LHTKAAKCLFEPFEVAQKCHTKDFFERRLRKDSLARAKWRTARRDVVTQHAQPVVVERDTELDGLIEWFRAYKRTQGIVSPYLIVHPAKREGKRMRGTKRRPVTAAQLYRYFKAAAKAVKLGGYTLRDIRPKAITDEAENAGQPTNKGAHRTEQMRRYYVKKHLPVRTKNTLKRLKTG
jgi:hypothetical protein